MKTQKITHPILPLSIMEGNKKAFTLVELIVVITILAILATISFISFSKYLSSARDTDRTTTLKNIEKWLDIFQVNTWFYPMPEWELSQWKVDESSTEIYAYKWIIADYTARLIKINKTPLDPLSWSNYIYAISWDKTKYQLATTLENSISLTHPNLPLNLMEGVIQKTYADYNPYQAKVIWNYPWYIKFSSWSNTYIANIPSLIWNNSWATINLLSTWTYFVVDKQSNLPYSIKDVVIQELTADKLIQKITWYTWSNLMSINITPILNATNKQSAIQQVFWTWSDDISKSKIASFWWTNSNTESFTMDTQKLEVITTWSVTTWGDIVPVYLNCNETTQSWYTFTPLAHWASLSPTKTITYWFTSLSASCNDWNLVYQTETVTCDSWYVEWPGLTCIADNCNWTITDPNAHSTATSQSVSTSWHYSETAWVCSYDCNTWFHYDSWTSLCVSDTKTFTCSAKPATWTVWNSVSSYTQTWNGTTFAPADSTTSYNATTSTTSCNYACDTAWWYVWNSGTSTCEMKLYVDDVFSTYLYTWNWSTQTINNWIDLAGYGGLVWIKHRNSNTWNALFDTNRWIYNRLRSETSSVQYEINDSLLAFNNNWFSIWPYGNVNASNYPLTSWTFRKAPKFFDVVTWTGDGVAGRTINHNLDISPGMVIIKRTDTTSTWAVWHRTVPNQWWRLNLPDMFETGYNQRWNYLSNPHTSTYITVGNWGDVNASWGQYVAYIFAHDTSADGIIQAGSFTTDWSWNAMVNLGWEPQYLMVKPSSVAGTWYIYDSMRGLTVNNSQELYANYSNAEQTGPMEKPIATGFVHGGNGAGYPANTTYIYLAIRKSNKPATTGSQVFNVDLWSNVISSNPQMYDTNFPVDLCIWTDHRSSIDNKWFIDRLRGSKVYLKSNTTDIEWGWSNFLLDTMNGFKYSGTYDGSNWIWLFFRRSPWIFDIVAYTWDWTTGRNINHNLWTTPELIILKSRNWAWTNWYINHVGITNWNNWYPTGFLNLTDALSWNTTTGIKNITQNTFEVNHPNTNTSNTSYNQYIAYLFATKPWISKVGSYTWNWWNLTIDAGLNSSARFILIKRTDSTWDWYVWDSARWIVLNWNDPHLSLNSTAAEVTTDDSVDPYTSWFIVKQNTATNINVTNGTYIYLAIN